MAKFKVITAVHLFLMDRSNKLLLARRFQTGYEDGKYSLIAGHVEEGEKIKRAMQREAFEEAGISIEEKDMEFAHVMYRRREKPDASDRIDFFFLTKKWKGIPKIMEVNKCDDMRWFAQDKIPKNTIAYIKSGIQKCYSNIKFSEFGW